MGSFRAPSEDAPQIIPRDSPHRPQRPQHCAQGDPGSTRSWDLLLREPPCGHTLAVCCRLRTFWAASRLFTNNHGSRRCGIVLIATR